VRGSRDSPGSRFIVVSGLPASGKSTLARSLSQALSLQLLDKDSFLEDLFDSAGAVSERARRELSREADADLRKHAEQSTGAVLVSWWKHPRSASDSGTTTEWLATLPGIIVEVHCQCSAEVAARRFLERKRHIGHLDHRWSYAELVGNLREQASLGPLGIGPLIVVGTHSPPDVTALLERLADEF
jgi:adenylate kinase family enzyme